jgi:predicted nucleic acid-binding protein
MACHIDIAMPCEEVMKLLFDTNIIIDALSGDTRALGALNRGSDGAVSVITVFEVMSGAATFEEKRAQSLLAHMRQIDVDPDIIAYAVTLAKERGLMMPDALIVATAQATGRTLVTRDGKLFNEFDDPPVVSPDAI